MRDAATAREPRSGCRSRRPRQPRRQPTGGDDGEGQALRRRTLRATTTALARRRARPRPSPIDRDRSSGSGQRRSSSVVPAQVASTGSSAPAPTRRAIGRRHRRAPTSPTRCTCTATTCWPTSRLASRRESRSPRPHGALRDRARGPRPSRSPADGPAVSLLPLAHGIGGVADPPIPLRLAYYGGAAVLVLSFAALGILWRTPRLEGDRRRGRLPAVWAARVLVGALGFGLFVVVFVAALVGERRRRGRTSRRRSSGSSSGRPGAALRPVRQRLGLAEPVARGGRLARGRGRAPASTWDAPYAYPGHSVAGPLRSCCSASPRSSSRTRSPGTPASSRWRSRSTAGSRGSGSPRSAETTGSNGEVFTVYFGFSPARAVLTLREGRLDAAQPAAARRPRRRAARNRRLRRGHARLRRLRRVRPNELLAGPALRDRERGGAIAFNLLGLVASRRRRGGLRRSRSSWRGESAAATRRLERGFTGTA